MRGPSLTVLGHRQEGAHFLLCVRLRVLVEAVEGVFLPFSSDRSVLVMAEGNAYHRLIVRTFVHQIVTHPPSVRTHGAISGIGHRRVSPGRVSSTTDLII